MNTMPALYVRNYEHVTHRTNSGHAFANRIALGVKTIETRGYPAPDSHLGKRIAIVATYKANVNQRWFVLQSSVAGSGTKMRMISVTTSNNTGFGIRSARTDGAPLRKSTGGFWRTFSR